MRIHLRKIYISANTIASIAFLPQASASTDVRDNKPPLSSVVATEEGDGLIMPLSGASTLSSTGKEVSVLDGTGRALETLPATARHASGHSIGFYYRKISDKKLEVMRTTVDGFVAYGWWDSWGKCAAGVVGGAITGGLGGAAGASVIPGVGTAVGGSIGAIGGGLMGAAAAC